MRLWFLTTCCILILTGTVSAQKQMSDRDVDRLKGKVKVIAVFLTYYNAASNADGFILPFTLSVDDKLPEKKPLQQSAVTYDEKGNRVKMEYYNSGQFYGTSEYGFLDGKRIVKYIDNSDFVDNMPKIYLPPISGVDDRKRDERFKYKFEYKYDGKGRRIEEYVYDNRDLLIQRITRNFDAKGREIERIETQVYYTAEKPIMREQLPLRYTTVYDDDAHETELAFFMPPQPNFINDGKPISKVSYSHYEFDSKGNWTKRIAETRQRDFFRAGSREGGDIYEKESRSITVEHRTICYF